MMNAAYVALRMRAAIQCGEKDEHEYAESCPYCWASETGKAYGGKQKTLRGKEETGEKMFIQEDDLKLNDWQFSQRKYLPYKVKKTLAERRIKEWYYNWDGQVYLSYSGGLDSTALLHMIRKTVGLEVPAVFSNTGLEFPEIVRFARQASGEFVEIYPRWKDGKQINI